MTEANPSAPSKKDLFLGLVHSFQAAAMQQMGKIMNPFTKEIERDLPQARLSIDMLEMLQERTSGNLTGEEARFLTHVLTELRLNYVAEVEEDRKRPAEGAGQPAAEGAGAPGAAEGAGQPTAEGAGQAEGTGSSQERPGA